MNDEIVFSNNRKAWQQKVTGPRAEDWLMPGDIVALRNYNIYGRVEEAHEGFVDSVCWFDVFLVPRHWSTTWLRLATLEEKITLRLQGKI